MNPKQTIWEAALMAASLPKIKYLHHLKFPVADLEKSLTFYEQVFGAQKQPNLTHKNEQGETDAYVLKIFNFEPMLELRVNAEAAQAQVGYDFLTLAVEDYTILQKWTYHLDRLEVEHFQELTGIDTGPLVFEDPDGHRIRIQPQTDEKAGQQAG